MIQIRLLGPVEVTIDRAPAPPDLLWRKHLALLVYLARSPHRARARDHLLALLWSDKDDEAARHSLNEAVRILRRSAPDCIHRQQERLQLEQELVEKQKQIIKEQKKLEQEQLEKKNHRIQ